MEVTFILRNISINHANDTGSVRPTISRFEDRCSTDDGESNWGNSHGKGELFAVIMTENKCALA